MTLPDAILICSTQCLTHLFVLHTCAIRADVEEVGFLTHEMELTMTKLDKWSIVVHEPWVPR